MASWVPLGSPLFCPCFLNPKPGSCLSAQARNSRMEDWGRSQCCGVAATTPQRVTTAPPVFPLYADPNSPTQCPLLLGLQKMSAPVQLHRLGGSGNVMLKTEGRGPRLAWKPRGPASPFPGQTSPCQDEAQVLPGLPHGAAREQGFRGIHLVVIVHSIQ